MSIAAPVALGSQPMAGPCIRRGPYRSRCWRHILPEGPAELRALWSQCLPAVQPVAPRDITQAPPPPPTLRRRLTPDERSPAQGLNVQAQSTGKPIRSRPQQSVALGSGVDVGHGGGGGGRESTRHSRAGSQKKRLAQPPWRKAKDPPTHGGRPEQEFPASERADSAPVCGGS